MKIIIQTSSKSEKKTETYNVENTTNSIINEFTEISEEEQYKKIISQICSLVNNGKLKSGDKLPSERSLAQRFGVGRASVRIALKFLEFIGLVHSKVGKGVYISVNSRDLAGRHIIELLKMVRDDPFKDLFEARMAVETTMAGLAATRATAEDLDEMNQVLDQMEKDIECGEKGVLATNTFHELIYKASKNIVLCRIAVMLGSLMHESRTITFNISGRAALSLEEHRKIYKAIVARNPQQASELMREHLACVAEARLIGWDKD